MKKKLFLLSIAIVMLLAASVLCLTCCSSRTDTAGVTTKKVASSKDSVKSSSNSSSSEKNSGSSGKSSSETKKSNKKHTKSSNISSGKSADEKQCTIVFKDENGKVLSEQSVKKGASVQEPTAPEKEDYYFYSWSRSLDNITENMEITPFYIKDGEVPKIEVGQVNAQAGDKNVSVKVSVKNNPGVASIALDVLYNEKNLKLTGFTYNTDALKGAATVPFNEKASPACLSMVNGADNITGDFDFATLYFDVLDDSKGSYPIILSCDKENVYNIDEKNVSFKLVNGLITIK